MPARNIPLIDLSSAKGPSMKKIELAIRLSSIDSYLARFDISIITS